MATATLSIKNLFKSYAVPVLQDIDIEIFPGEVCALLGSNGAGKSTLCNIIAGQVSADSGDIKLHSVPYRPNSVSDAEVLGIRMVTQELRSVDMLSVAENISLAEFPHQAGFIDYKLINQKARDLMCRFGLPNLDPRQQLKSLGMAQKQLVEIARVLNHQCDLLILDEPTAALGEEEVELLYAEIEQLKSRGVAIIYISHRMNEISQIADRSIVLRDGRVVASDLSKNLSQRDLIRLMTGSFVAKSVNFEKRDHGPVTLLVDNLSTRNKLRGINLDVYQGEVLGVAGLVGSGRSELLRAIFGADPRSSGEIRVGPEKHYSTILTPEDAVKNGVGLISEDRKSEGLLPGLSVLQNIAIASLSQFSNKLGLFDSTSVLLNVEKQIENLRVDAASSEQSVNNLSGGSQQKIIIARWLLVNCNILLFDEPNRGIDAQSKQAIYDLINKLACSGKSIVVVSSEPNELLNICDRIAVLSDGRVSEIFHQDNWSPEAITAAAFKHYAS